MPIDLIAFIEDDGVRPNAEYLGANSWRCWNCEVGDVLHLELPCQILIHKTGEVRCYIAAEDPVELRFLPEPGVVGLFVGLLVLAVLAPRRSGLYKDAAPGIRNTR